MPLGRAPGMMIDFQPLVPEAINAPTVKRFQELKGAGPMYNRRLTLAGEQQLLL